MTLLLIVLVVYALVRVIGSIGTVSQALMLTDDDVIMAEPIARKSAAKSIAFAFCVILVVVIVMGLGAIGVQP